MRAICWIIINQCRYQYHVWPRFLLFLLRSLRLLGKCCDWSLGVDEQQCQVRQECNGWYIDTHTHCKHTKRLQWEPTGENLDITIVYYNLVQVKVQPHVGYTNNGVAFHHSTNRRKIQCSSPVSHGSPRRQLSHTALSGNSTTTLSTQPHKRRVDRSNLAFPCTTRWPRKIMGLRAWSNHNDQNINLHHQIV